MVALLAGLGGLATLAGPTRTAVAAFPLAADGRAAQVVVLRDAPPRVLEAVDDLLTYIERATGATPVLLRPATVAAAAGLRDPSVLIGAAAGPPPEEREVGYDGYRLAVTDRRIEVAGATPAGTANGIYDLLARGLGVRFLVPGDDGVVVPAQHEVLIPATRRLERPAFDLRRAWYNDNVARGATSAWREELARFERRNRGGGVPAVIGHFFNHMVPPDRYFEEHPEYFAEVQGTRRADGQLCTSNPYVVHLAAQYWIDRFDRDPDLRIGSLSPNDGGLYCECETCRLQAADPAARLVEFMNEVARRVSAHHPARLLSFYAYGPLSEPTGIRLHPNLVATVARYNVCQAHAIEHPGCASNVEFRRRLEGWQRDAQQILIRDYACWWHLPDLTLDVLAANLRRYEAAGALGVSREYLHRTFGSDLVRYVDLQLLWDPAQDPDRIMDDFLRGRFGPAASGMRRVFDGFREALENTPPSQAVRASETDAFDAFSMPAMRSALRDLDALAASSTGPEGARVAIEADLLRAAVTFREVTELTQRYSITGRAEDLETLRERMASAATLYARLGEQDVIGSSFAEDLEAIRLRVEGPGLRAPIDGAFVYEDDMAHGGFSRRDAERIEGFYAGRYGLSLLPGGSGRISYAFEAAAGTRFTHAVLTGLVFRGSSTRIEVRAGDRTSVFAENVVFDDPQLEHDLTDLVRGTSRFTLVFRATNRGDRPQLCLDQWGIRIETR
ncbi:MAG: DUF4838 domain-containing protein [Candidatus Eiseniibacteriota bacterium]|jgi:hypothetical protein